MVEKKKVDFQKQGRKNRARGGEFERKVRLDLESKGWIVNKWLNNVDLEQGKIIPAKRRFNPFSKVMAIGTGFPDFICFRNSKHNLFDVILLEVKKNGYLDKEEKEKAKWYLKNGIVKEILIAQGKKEGRRIVVEYQSVLEKYPKLCE